MTLDAVSLQRCLKDGKNAVQRRNFVRGRQLLLQVVAQDPGQEEAWWWLYQATDDVVEQMRALENVLRLNPEHPEALADLTAIRQEQIGAGQAPADWKRVLAAGAVEPSDALDNPYQCPACGQPTRHNDHKCPNCGRALFWRLAKGTGSHTLHSLALLLIIGLAVGLVELVGPLWVLGLAGETVPAPNQASVESFDAVQLVLGDIRRLEPAMAALLVPVLVGRAVVLLVTVLGIRLRWAGAYYLALAAGLADVGLGLTLLVLGVVGVVAPALHAGLALAALILLVAVTDDFAVNFERILVRPDGGARTALDFYHRGQVYSQRGLWALAVAQWRRAVGLAPRTAHYYRDLAVGLAQIRSWERSLRAIEQAQRLAPDDPALAEIAKLVRQQAQTDTLLQT